MGRRIIKITALTASVVGSLLAIGCDKSDEAKQNNTDNSIVKETVQNNPDIVIDDEYMRSLKKDNLYIECNNNNGINYDSISWYMKSEDYYMFLPSFADESKLTVWETFEGNIQIDGNDISNGSEIELSVGEHTVKVNNNEKKLIVMKSANIPAVFIDGEEEISYLNDSKDNSCSGLISFVSDQGEVVSTELKKMNGRGNTSWNAGRELFGKFPYNIKLSDSVDIFGIATDKKWCLIPQVFDESMVRNIIMNDLSKAEELEYTPGAENVDVYYNNEYIGTYLLSQKISIGENSLLTINDLEKNTEDANEGIDLSQTQREGVNRGLYGVHANSSKYYSIENNPDDITGGYLLEFDLEERYEEEVSGFVTDNRQPVVIKSPEYASKEQVEYISDYYQRVEDAVYSDNGYNSQGEYYTDLIDVDSFVKVYLINEMSMNLDGGATSFYLYKDIDGLIKAGPVWDFDWALGSYEGKDGISLVDGDKWYIKRKRISGSSKIGLLGKLCQHDDFWEMVKKEWNENMNVYVKAFYGETTADGIISLDEYYNKYSASAQMNYIRYDILTMSPQWGSSYTGDTYEENFEFIKNFLKRRCEFLDGME